MSRTCTQFFDRPVFNVQPILNRLRLLAFFLVFSGFAQAQSVSIDYPFFRQSFAYGTQVPVQIRVTPPSGTSVVQVDLLYSPGSSTTVVGTSTSAPYTINWTVPNTGFNDLYARVTFSNSVTAVTTSRTVNGFPTTCPAASARKKFYVKAGASTATTTTLGESITNPTGSFQKLIFSGVNGARPLPGDTIFFVSAPTSYTLKDASQNLATMYRSGLEGCPVVIANLPGERPKLKLDGWNGISIPTGVSYVEIHGLDIEGNNANVSLNDAINQPGSCANPTGSVQPRFNGNGITITGVNGGTLHPHHIKVVNNIVHDCGGGGINAIEADYITIEGNTSYNNSWYTVYGTSGISVFHPWNFDTKPGYHNYVVNNRCYGNKLFVRVPAFGCNFTDGNGIIIDDFKNSQASSSIRYQEYTGRTLVANNIVYNNGGSGIHAYKGLRTDIVNNTAYQNSQSQGPSGEYPVGEIYAQESGDINIVNNIIRPITGENTFTTNRLNTTTTYRNNLYLVDAVSQVPTSATGTVVSDNIIASPASETAVFVNATTDPATANFQLKPGSAAVNAGTNDYAAAIPTDFLGVARPQGSNVDVGVYELQGQPIAFTRQPESASAVCAGAAVSTSVDVSGPATSYQWFKDEAPVAGQTTATLSLTNAQAGDAGAYKVVVTGFNSLTSSAFSLTVNSLPTVSISPQNGLLTAANPSLTLTAATSVADLRWSDNSTNTTLVVGAAGLYSVTATSPQGCTASASATVGYDQIAPVATLTPSSATLTCATPSVTLTAGGGSSYAFSAGATQIGTSNQAVVSQGGTYSVIVTGTSGNTAVATATVELDNTAPSITLVATPSLTATTGSSVTLTASGATTYQWSNGASTTAITVNTASTYSVTGTAPNGCTATVQATVVFGAPPTVSMTFPQYNSSYFAGTALNIKVNTSTPAGTTITKVEYYSSTSFGAFSKIGEVTSAPYSLTYTLPDVPANGQSRQFRAVITNSAGFTAIQGNNNTSVTVYPPTYTSTRNWYVSAAASAANTAGTEAQPFNTIQKAADRVAPGDTVFVMAGRYTSTSQFVVGIQRTGTPTRPIVFMPYKSDKPVVALGNSNFDGFRILPAAAYVRIQGFEVEGNNANITLAQAQAQPGACEGPSPTATPIARFNGNGMSIVGSQGDLLRPHHIVIANNTVHDCAGQGIGGSECDYVTIENNVVYNNSWYTVYGTSGINIINAWNYDNNSTAPRIIIRKNRSYGNKLLIAWNIGGTGTNCRFFDGNGIILDNNRGTNPNNPAQIKNPLGDYTGKILIENNLCYLNGGRGINVNYSDNALVINNTTYQNGQSDGPFGIGIDNEFIMQGSRGARIYNNIFYGKPGELPSSVTGSQDVQHNNNLTFSNFSNGYFTGEQNIVGKDPQFVDAANGDFRLAPTSPALNAGSDIAGQFAQQDILGIDRPQGAGVDMGALELQGTPLTITQQPASASAVCAGAAVSTSVDVSGPVDSYQWFKDGVALTGQTSATLSLTDVQPSHAGSYSVVVSGFNSLTSTAFGLTVNTPPSAPDVSSLTLTQGTPSAALTVTNCVGTVNWNGVDGETSLPVSTSATGTFSYSVVCKAGPCISPVTNVTVTITAPVPTDRLSVYHRDGDNNQTTNNTIRPYLKLYNEGTTSVPYGEITIRYWLTAENFAPLTNLSVYWAALGTSKVKMNYVPLETPRQGAFGYVEYRFDSSAGTLAPTSNSGEIQTGVGKQNWTNFSESDDHSFAANATYTKTDRITVYRNNTLIWGTEPAAITPVTALKVYSENKNSSPTTNQISTHLKVANEGNVAVDYSGLTIRYWFSAEGDKPLVHTIDFAELGNTSVRSKFVKESRQGTDTYLELSFAPSLGQLHPASSTGIIQQRINKSDWSAFNETNDYSYRVAGPLTENVRITAYLNGTLVYGQEPTSGARIGVNESASAMRVVVLGNPIQGDQVEVAVSGIEGQPLQLLLTDVQGQVVATYQTGKAAPVEQHHLPIGRQRAGMLLLQVSTNREKQTIKLLKP